MVHVRTISPSLVTELMLRSEMIAYRVSSERSKATLAGLWTGSWGSNNELGRVNRVATGTTGMQGFWVLGLDQVVFYF
jgi:hypothetical protein